MENIKKIVIWGYPLNTHTHSYIHYGWHKGFTHLKYDTYWFSDNSFINHDKFDYNNTLFITEGYADKNIPIVKSSIYFVHMCINPLKYLNENVRLIDIRFNIDEIKDCNYNYNLKNYIKNNEVIKISDASYYQIINHMRDLRGCENTPNLKNNFTYEVLYTMWATDLLPDEFCYEKVDENINNCENVINYVGSVSNSNANQLITFADECKKYNILFTLNDPWKNPLTFDCNMKLIQKSIISPDIRGNGDIKKIAKGETGTCHKKYGYIPCRIFKSISYGCIGVTNSKHVYNLLENKVIYSDNERELLHLGIKNRKNKDLIIEQMNLVKEKHTYLNRINDILNIVDLNFFKK